MALGTDGISAAIQESRLVTVVGSAVRSSRIATGLGRILGESTVVAGAGVVARTVRTWILASVIGSGAGSLRETGGYVLDRAVVGRLVEDSVHAVESSRLYGWAGEGSGSEVVVIDLRETLSVGPVRAALDELLESIRPATTYSLLVRTGRGLLEEFQEAPVRVASFAVLAAVLAGGTLGVAVGVLDAVGFLLALAFAVPAAVGTRIRVDYAGLAGSPPVRRLARLLEPPEPPGDGPREECQEDRDRVSDGPSRDD